MLKLGITEKNELVGMEFNFGAHSLTFCLLRPGTLRVPGHFFEIVFVFAKESFPPLDSICGKCYTERALRAPLSGGAFLRRSLYEEERKNAHGQVASARWRGDHDRAGEAP